MSITRREIYQMINESVENRLNNILLEYTDPDDFDYNTEDDGEELDVPLPYLLADTRDYIKMKSDDLTSIIEFKTHAVGHNDYYHSFVGGKAWHSAGQTTKQWIPGERGRRGFYRTVFDPRNNPGKMIFKTKEDVIDWLENENGRYTEAIKEYRAKKR